MHLTSTRDLSPTRSEPHFFLLYLMISASFRLFGYLLVSIADLSNVMSGFPKVHRRSGYQNPNPNASIQR
ncbi:hypothetical protein AQUCO_03100077v1 [Aquilegia coerulea]|uniref:Uncharacterized protein n=1 Tax=Aquilegia coerulea TaxID=218851 RepID=A0A2G5D0M2_AQUCA|nr:hypothetical protein AQUCO_03100077v1 [Aquilegia coerulea]